MKLKKSNRAQGLFQNDKASGEACLKSAFFEKKSLFLTWIESIKNNFRLEGIRPQPAFLYYPSVFLSKKVPFYITKEPFFFKNWFNSFHSK